MIFSTTNITVEEKFEKNRISCSFASADKSCTIGFTKTRLAKPQTVLKGNRLNKEVEIDVILSKTKDSQHFEKIIQNKIGYSLEELNLLFGLYIVKIRCKKILHHFFIVKVILAMKG